MLHSALVLLVAALAHCAVPPRPAGANMVDQPISYWFGQFNSSFDIMQQAFYNSSIQAPTLDWIAAFINTLTASSITTYTKAASRGYHADLTDVKIIEYERTMHKYFAREHVADIYDAAFDDIQWVVLEWIEALEAMKTSPDMAGMTATTDYADRARYFYDKIDHEFDTSSCNGGLTWNPKLRPYKNAITNELFLSSAIGMYLHLPGMLTRNQAFHAPNATDSSTTTAHMSAMQNRNEQYLHDAYKAYNWLMTSGLVNEKGLIIDGFHIPENSTECSLKDNTLWTYNQGVLLSGLRGLWQATRNGMFLMDAYRLIEATILATGWTPQGNNDKWSGVKWSGLGTGGVIQDSCDQYKNCTQDALIFKGIYFHHLSKFCEPLVQAFIDDDTFKAHHTFCTSIMPWVEHNAAKAIASSAYSSEFIAGAWVEQEMEDLMQFIADSMASAESSAKPRTHPRQLITGNAWCEDERCTKFHYELSRRTERDVAGKRMQRSLETHASGVAVIKAALDFSLWYKS